MCRDSVILVLTSPQTVGCLMAIGLNLTLPIDDDSDEVELERDRLQKMLSIGVKGRHLPTDIEMNPAVTVEHTQKFTPESFKVSGQELGYRDWLEEYGQSLCEEICPVLKPSSRLATIERTVCRPKHLQTSLFCAMYCLGLHDGY